MLMRLQNSPDDPEMNDFYNFNIHLKRCIVKLEVEKLIKFFTDFDRVKQMFKELLDTHNTK